MSTVAATGENVPALLETYRNHKLTASIEGDIYVGKVFNKETQVAYCEAIGRVQTQQHLRLIVDADIEKKYKDRGGRPVSFDELKIALIEIKAYLESSYINMLRHHYRTSQGTMSLEALARLGCCSSTTEVYFVYASIARCLCDELAYMPPTQNSGRDPMLSMLLQEPNNAPVKEHSILLALSPEIQRALIEAKW